MWWHPPPIRLTLYNVLIASLFISKLGFKLSWPRPHYWPTCLNNFFPFSLVKHSSLFRQSVKEGENRFYRICLSLVAGEIFQQEHFLEYVKKFPIVSSHFYGSCGLSYKIIKIINDASKVMSEWRHNLEHHLRLPIMLQESSITSSENIYSTGVTYEDRHMMIRMFIVQVIGCSILASFILCKFFFTWVYLWNLMPILNHVLTCLFRWKCKENLRK